MTRVDAKGIDFSFDEESASLSRRLRFYSCKADHEDVRPFVRFYNEEETLVMVDDILYNRIERLAYKVHNIVGTSVSVVLMSGDDQDGEESIITMETAVELAMSSLS